MHIKLDMKKERNMKTMNKEEKLTKAIIFATIKHANQKRKDGTPYIYHPLAVAELLKKYGYDVDYQIAAVLHDVLEDTDATEDEVKEFGMPVYEAVKLVTRPDGMDEAEYVRRILENPMAAAVKNADKIHNLYEIAFSEDKRAIARYARKAEIYYEGNFSMALDDAIAKATYMSHFHDERKEYKESIMRKGIPNFTHKEMRLNSKSENIAKKEAYNLYMKNTDIPDLNDNKLKFAIVDGNDPLWYCYIGNEEAPEKTWRLTKGGWVDDSEENIFFAYGFDISTVSKKDFIDAMNELFVSNWFYDFVEKKKICGKQNQ